MNIAGLFVGSLEGAATVRKISFKIYNKYNVHFQTKREIKKLCLITVDKYRSIIFHRSLFYAKLRQNESINSVMK